MALGLPCGVCTLKMGLWPEVGGDTSLRQGWSSSTGQSRVSCGNSVSDNEPESRAVGGGSMAPLSMPQANDDFVECKSQAQTHLPTVTIPVEARCVK
jgi:hypothetical protein